MHSRTFAAFSLLFHGPLVSCATASCNYLGGERIMLWVSRGHDHGRGETTVTSTQTVEYMIDTALNTSMVNTLLPSDYVPSQTNSDGTRIGTMTWLSLNRTMTTVL